MNKSIQALLWLGVFIVGTLMIWQYFLKNAQQPVAEVEDVDGRTFVDVEWKHFPGIKQFKLTDQAGEKFDSSSLAGKPFVISFFFANCPSICRQLNTKIQSIAEEFDGKELYFVSVTCNPEQDTPEVLQRYAESLEADSTKWKFLTGQFYKIQEVGRQFDVVLDLNSHTDDILLVDRWGRYRDRFKWNDTLEIDRLKVVAKELLAEQTPPLDQTFSTRNALAGVSHRVRKKQWLDEFFLTDHQENEFFSRDLTGQVWIGSQFFSTCPSICRQQNEYLAGLLDRLGDRPVEIVSISTKPSTDTPQVLSEYRDVLGIESQHWHFLTGELPYIKRISEEYFKEPLTAGEHHSVKLVIFDRWGIVRGKFDWRQDGAEAEMLKLIDQLILEETPNDHLAVVAE